MLFFTDTTITHINNGKTSVIEVDSPLGKEVLDLYKKEKEHEIPEVIKAHELIDNVNVKEVGGRLEVNGVLMDVELANKVRDFKSKGMPFDYLIKLAERIDKMESYHVRNQLYAFLKHNGHPITKDGKFIAYKMVSKEFKDLHTGKFDNSVGSVVEMERRKVNDDPTQTCSAGLHVASFDYAHNFGSGHLVLCEVAPEDVVAVPIDYDQKKMRCCKYKVVGIAKELIEEPTFDEFAQNREDLSEGDDIEWEGHRYHVISLSRRGDRLYADLEAIDFINEDEFNVDLTEDEFYFI